MTKENTSTDKPDVQGNHAPSDIGPSTAKKPKGREEKSQLEGPALTRRTTRARSPIDNSLRQVGHRSGEMQESVRSFNDLAARRSLAPRGSIPRLGSSSNFDPLLS